MTTSFSDCETLNESESCGNGYKVATFECIGPGGDVEEDAKCGSKPYYVEACEKPCPTAPVESNDG